MGKPALPLVAADGVTPLLAAANYTAADLQHQDLAGWYPRRVSADSALLWEQNTLVGRAEDQARNDGWAKGGIRRYLDNMIGSGLKLSARVDYQALGLSAEWGAEFNAEVEARYRLYAEDPDCYCDAGRRLTIGGIHRLMAASELVAGESLAISLWLERGGPSATAIMIVDPARLSNPMGEPESEYLRGGIELGAYGEPRAYWIRNSHPGDAFAWSADFLEWERVEREHPWGRRRVIHSYEMAQPAQSRGVSIFAPIVKKMKMIGRHDEVTLQAAVVDSLLGAYIESPLDHELTAQALGAGASDRLSAYQSARADYHGLTDTRFPAGGHSVPILFPGEKINLLSSQRPNGNFVAFQEFGLRNIASALGLSYEQLSMDWSKTNYSSARAALLEVWKFLSTQREFFAQRVASQIYALWLEEEIDSGRIRLPRGAPDFYQPGAPSAYCRARWMGPPRGHVDTEKEAKGDALRLELGSTDLQSVCAEQGRDWREVLQQRKVEMDYMRELGLTPPSWSAMNAAFPAEPQPAEQRGAGQ